jgi:hypothetical protein
MFAKSIIARVIGVSVRISKLKRSARRDSAVWPCKKLDRDC